jgi:hypothetical protein
MESAMALTRWLTTVGVVIALGVHAVPADADQGRGRGGRPQGGTYARGYRGYPGNPAHPGQDGRFWGPPVRFGYPYFGFGPRVRPGAGFWLGYATPFPPFGYGAPPFPYPSVAPYLYQMPYSVPYPPAGYDAPPPIGYGTSLSVGYRPDWAPRRMDAPPGPNDGGVSLEITPDGVGVFVDGSYVGPVGEFGPARPLTLPPGPHRIEVRAPGFNTITLEVTITPGEVIPFRGVLTPLE